MDLNTTLEHVEFTNPRLVYQEKAGDAKRFFVTLQATDSTLQHGDMVYQDVTTKEWALLDIATSNADIYSVGVVHCMSACGVHFDEGNVLNYDTNGDGVLELLPEDVEIVLLVGKETELYQAGCTIRDGIANRIEPDMGVLEATTLASKVRVVEFEGTRSRTFVLI